MAIEGVVADPGAGGAEFGGDDVAGGSGTVFIPYTKLMSGADGSVELIGGDAANGLDVDVTRSALPTGASTAAKQPALGTAGTASTDVISVQGIAAMTPLLVTASAGTNLNTSALALEAGGNLAAIAASASVLDDWDETDRAKVNLIVGQAGIAAGTGTDGATVPRVTLATNVALPAGTNALGSVIPQPTTAGGLTIARDIDLDNGTLTVVKNAAGQLYGMTIANLGTVAVFVKFYDATSGTLGTGTPVLTITIPGNATDDTVLTTSFGGMGLAFATGICVGAGTGVADNDNTDPGANIVIANIYYK